MYVYVCLSQNVVVLADAALPASRSRTAYNLEKPRTGPAAETCPNGVYTCTIRHEPCVVRRCCHDCPYVACIRRRFTVLLFFFIIFPNFRDNS